MSRAHDPRNGVRNQSRALATMRAPSWRAA
jgi:hypothetical protein